MHVAAFATIACLRCGCDELSALPLYLACAGALVSAVGACKLVVERAHPVLATSVSQILLALYIVVALILVSLVGAAWAWPSSP